jgi:hypothetical protein
MSQRVKRYTFTVFARLPLSPQLQTYRCVALGDAPGPLADIAQPGWDRPPLPYKIQTRSCVREYSGKYAIRIGYPELTAISR